MRNTIFTSLATAGIALAGGAQAEMPDFPYGCFARDYTEAHLARNPQQSVRRIVLHGAPNEGPDGSPGFAFLGIDVEFAAQGIGVEDAVAGEAYGQFFRCYDGFIAQIRCVRFFLLAHNQNPLFSRAWENTRNYGPVNRQMKRNRPFRSLNPV